MSLGIVIGPGIGGFLADFGLKAPLLVSALVSLVAVFFSVIVLKESGEAGNLMSDSKPDPMAKMIVESVRKPYFIPLVITLIMSFGLMAYESVLGLFVDNQFGATPQEIAVMITATGIISVIAQLFIVDRIVARYGEGTVLSTFLGVATVGFLLTFFASSYILFFIVTLIIFLATSILRPVLTTLVSKMAGNEQGFAMGLNNAYMSIGNILGPLLAGVLYDVDITYPFILGMVVLAITTIASVGWQRKRMAVREG